MATKALSLVLLGFLAATGFAAAADVDVQVGRAISPNVGQHVFFPQTVVVNPGDEVVWKAGSPEPHTVTQFPVTAGSWDSSPALDHTSALFRSWFGPGGFLLPTQTFNRTFSQAGVFPYFCLLHDGMGGVIHVDNRTGAAAISPPSTWHVDVGWGTGDTTVFAFAPNDLTVLVGDTVQWENKASSEPHTVTGAPPNPDAPPGPDNQFSWNSSPAFDFTAIPPDWFGGPRGVLSLPAPGEPSEGAPHTEFRHTFAESGMFSYFCKLHPEMWGTVIVLEHPASMMNSNNTGNMNPNTTSGTTGGSRVPGPPLGMALAGLALLALALRRR